MPRIRPVPRPFPALVLTHFRSRVGGLGTAAGGALHTKTPSSDAPLPLPEIAVGALERHRVEENRRRLAAGDMWGDCGLVFTTRLGDPVDPRNFDRDFKLRAAKAGVPVVPIHSTRRTCASLLVALDVHP